MTIAEKPEVIDLIMDDFSRNAASIPSPAWQGELLRERGRSLEECDQPTHQPRRYRMITNRFPYAIYYRSKAMLFGSMP
ncbi:MAG: hypothetical protein ABI999_00010 [Acidobacteriota bacterium]